jgi:hypothetical protein
VLSVTVTSVQSALFSKTQLVFFDFYFPTGNLHYHYPNIVRTKWIGRKTAIDNIFDAHCKLAVEECPLEDARHKS